MIRRIDRFNGKHPSIGGGGHAANESENGLEREYRHVPQGCLPLSKHPPTLKRNRKIQTNEL